PLLALGSDRGSLLPPLGVSRVGLRPSRLRRLSPSRLRLRPALLCLAACARFGGAGLSGQFRSFPLNQAHDLPRALDEARRQNRRRDIPTVALDLRDAPCRAALHLGFAVPALFAGHSSAAGALS